MTGRIDILVLWRNFEKMAKKLKMSQEPKNVVFGNLLKKTKEWAFWVLCLQLIKFVIFP